ncbi:hypothetical protein DRN63_04800, partial [Nanoarchaeota archaeon]
GEKIVEEIKPLPVLKWYFFVKWFISLLISFWIPFFAGFGLLLFLLEKHEVRKLIPGFSEFQLWLFILAILSGVICFLLAWALSRVSYGKFYYWITNKRIVMKRGVIGYKIISIPYERISDIIISRSLLERIFGIASLHIQSLAGQFSISTYAVMGSEGQLLAIPNPEETQKKILQLIRAKRKEEGLTM